MLTNVFSKSALRSRIRRAKKLRRHQSTRRNRFFEPLEPRIVLANHTFQVTTLRDIVDAGDGQLSLREAIIQANSIPTTDAVEIHLPPFSTDPLLIEKDTIQIGRNTEGAFDDPDYGDFDIRRSMLINGNGIVIRGQKLGRVFQISNGANVTFNVLQIFNGGEKGIHDGGGMHISGGSSVTLNNVHFVNNTTAEEGDGRGGAIFAQNADKIIINRATFSHNEARAGRGSDGHGGGTRGGAIYLDGGDLEIYDAEFDHNRAVAGHGVDPGNDGGGAFGGAIYVERGHLLLQRGSWNIDPTFRNNAAIAGDAGLNDDEDEPGSSGGPAHGGAIDFAGNGTLRIESARFEDNSAEGGRGGGSQESGGHGGDAAGGALFLGDRRLTFFLSDSEFLRNQARGGGVLTNTILSSRGGDAKGGAIGTGDNPEFPDDDRVMDLSSNVFDQNAALGGHGRSQTGQVLLAAPGGDAFGGAVYAAFGDLAVSDSIFRTNRAQAGDGRQALAAPASDGGNAGGGAIYATNRASLSITGQLGVPDGDFTEVREVMASSYFYDNAAIGGTGGDLSHDNAGEDERAGDGGSADGGAVVATSGELTITGAAFVSNSAQGGNASRGPAPGSSTDFGSAGGRNGSARGGALMATVKTTLDDVAFTSNMAIGGRLDVGDDAGTGALSAGAAGRLGANGQGLQGGDGGSAFGGAVYVDSSGLTISGGGFAANQAIASGGGSGGAGGDHHPGGNGGLGGSAAGGALWALFNGSVDIDRSAFVDNYVQAGRGGSGGKGGNGDPDGHQGGHGGQGGNAWGGGMAIASQPLVGGPDSVGLNEVYVRGNMAIAGDGGLAGTGGGAAKEVGGTGGDGGNGGSALGGGIYLSGVNTTLERSTIEKNVVSSGFGAQGGYGGGAGWRGGDAGHGGHAGNAAGGGIHYIAGALTAVRSTVVENHVASGFGGNGGFGGFGEIGGGSGGNGGNGGSARGGGISVGPDSSPLTATSLTIGKNFLDAGGAGMGGPTGRAIDEVNGGVPIRYDVAPNVTIFEGAARVLDGRFDGAVGEPFVNYQISQDSLDLPSAQSLDVGAMLIAETGVAAAASAAASGAGVAAGIGVGLATAIGTKTVGTIALVGQAAAIGTTVLTFSGATFLTAFGSFSAGGIVIAIGAAVLARALVYGAATGDWEGMIGYTLGTPGSTYPRDFGVLLTGIDEPDNVPEAVLNFPGADGAQGVAEGTGIWGSATLTKTIVSDNDARERFRSREVGAFRDANGTYRLGGDFASYHLTEGIQTPDRADVAGGVYFYDGTNFIGAVNSGFVNDLKGTLSNPLSARFDDETGNHGGAWPTLKLLVDSPARNAAFFPNEDFSQNDNRVLGEAEIGAWENGAPVAMDFNLTHLSTSPRTVTIPTFPVLVQASDPDGDPITLERSLQVLRGSAEFEFDENEQIVGIRYTAPTGFFGEDRIRYVVSDGDLFAAGIIFMEVEPNKAPVANPGEATTDEDVAIDVDLRSLVSDVDTPLDALTFQVDASNGGTVELLPDGHTARFLPPQDFNGQTQFSYKVMDPGAGTGPAQEVGPQSVIVSVAAVNDAPVNVLPATQSVNEDAELAITGLGVTDVDAAEGEDQLKVSLRVQHGTLSLGQLTDVVFSQGDGNEDAEMTFTGSALAIESALAGLSYQPAPNFNGSDQLEIVSDDLGNFGAGAALTDADVLDIVVHAVNDAPVNEAPESSAGYEDVKLVISGISVSDLDIDGTGEVQVTLGVEHGTITLGRTDGLTFVSGGNGSRSMAIRGMLADINAALENLVYLGDLNYSGSDRLSILTNDLGNTGLEGPLTDVSTVDITLLSSFQQAAMLSDNVNQLKSDGVLSKGQANGLLSKVQLKGTAGDTDKVRSFLDQVQDHLVNGILTQQQAEQLLAAGRILLLSVSNADR
jgi:hypothetical protein